MFQKISENEIFNSSLGITRFSIEKMLSQSSEKLRRETLLCYGLGKFRCRKNLKIGDGGAEGLSRSCVENFLSHLVEKLSSGTL